MPIQILPARLANQIAAGEVVERPASVVKELVENSLDAGATRIDIDIDKGGSRTIRIRDNGKGIPKDELGLALSRHATSKIATLDDLEAIMSLGFRGEALASISSVSRLTLTSRPADQEQAWAAYAEGRDMEVQLKPAAHPVGSTLEVLDLFFNTPARRKFLRTEKTEFAHIDELLKRIALSRMDVTINLRHNGKMVRQYRSASTQIQKERRLAAVCGSAFLDHALAVELSHGDLTLTGWICTPQGARAQNDIQYCYVNGRMMKDKLINHAIRQAYESSLAPEQYAAYVLFIDVDPHQVDVNVHPAKHEVRFHQARLVHDFICQGLQSALIQGSHDELAPHIPAPRASAHAQTASTSASPTTSYAQGATPAQTVEEPNAALMAIARTPAYPNQAPSQAWLGAASAHMTDATNAAQNTVQTRTADEASSRDEADAAARDIAASEHRDQVVQDHSARDHVTREHSPRSPSTGEYGSRSRAADDGYASATGYTSRSALDTTPPSSFSSSPAARGSVASSGSSRSEGGAARRADDGPTPEEIDAYQRLLQTVPPTQPERSVSAAASSPVASAPVSVVSSRQDAVGGSNGIGLGKALCLVEQQYLLLSRDEGIALLSLPVAQRLAVKAQLRHAQYEGLKPQPLLIPHAVPVEPSMIDCAEQHALLLKQLGIQLKAKNKHSLVILSVSQPLRQQNLQKLIPALLDYLASVAEDEAAQGWDKLLDWLVDQLMIATAAFTLSQAIQLVTELEQRWGTELELYYPHLLRPVDLRAAIEAFNYD